MTDIKSILVDYGGVLFENPSNTEYIARIAEDIGIDPTRLKEGIYGKNRELWNRAKLGLISETDHWYEAEKNLQVSKSKLYWARHELFETAQVHDRFVDFLKSLHGHYSLGIVSNAIPAFMEAWRKLGFLDWFDVVINSSLVKLAKPDPEIYMLAYKRLNLPPEACILVDDQPKNLTTASQMGFQVVHYVDESQAIAAINKLLGTQNN
jgi:putative hydrolase of the HAD superfamily